VVFSVIVAQKWRDTLTPNVPVQFGLTSADGYDGGVLPLLRWLQLSSLVVTDPRPDGVLLSRLEELPDDRVLDILGVRYLIANEDTPGRSDLRMVDFGDLRLFARPAPVPRSLLVFDASVADDQAALAFMARPQFDPNRQIILSPEHAAPVQQSLRTAVPVEPLVMGAHRWQARVSLSEPGYLLQREAWYPGWRARVDGVEVPVLRANLLYRAIRLEPGEHSVEFYFESGSYARGVVVSLVALLLVGVLLVWRRGGPVQRA
jgi:hypothetical protein